MEDVIEVDHRPYDPKRPVVCVDELPVRRIGETRTPIPANPGRPRRYDYGYVRNGTANRFLAFAPRVGRRHVEVTDRRTAQGVGTLVRWLVGDVHEAAGRVVLVGDNLNVHATGGLYETVAPADARRTAKTIEWPDTPTHGSRPNVAECEFPVLSRRCLDRRIASVEELRRPVTTWENARNDRLVEVKWQFTTAKARSKLHRLYPSTR